jgi:hypothetical protein
MARPSKCTSKRRTAVLELLRKGNGIEQAARAVGTSGPSLRRWRRDDPDFDEACQAAADFCADIAENVLYVRGIRGDTLALLAWLRAHRPEKYHRKMLIAGDPDGAPVAVDHTHAAARGRILILPANGRAALSAEEIQSERAAIAHQHLIENSGSPPALIEIAEGDDDAADAA